MGFPEFHGKGYNKDHQFTLSQHKIWLWVSALTPICLSDHELQGVRLLSIVHIVSNHFIDFFFLAVVFVSILGIWKIQSPFSDHPGCIGHGPQVKADISCPLLQFSATIDLAHLALQTV